MDYVSFYVSCNLDKVTGMAQSVKIIATDWTVEGANSDEEVIFCDCPDRPNSGEGVISVPVQIGPEVDLSSCTVGNGFLTGD
jgi:hypothetical protein